MTLLLLFVFFFARIVSLNLTDAKLHLGNG